VLSCAAHAGDEDTSTPPADTTTSDFERAAGLGHACVAGVLEVVEAEVGRQPDLVPGIAPLPAEGGAAEGCAAPADEQQPVGLLRGEPVEVPPHVDIREVRQYDGALAGLGLGVAGHSSAGGQLGRGPVNGAIQDGSDALITPPTP
jgi:hypothetical protein